MHFAFAAKILLVYWWIFVFDHMVNCYFLGATCCYCTTLFTKIKRTLLLYVWCDYQLFSLVVLQNPVFYFIMVSWVSEFLCFAHQRANKQRKPQKRPLNTKFYRFISIYFTNSNVVFICIFILFSSHLSFFNVYSFSRV